ncbi:serpin family protein [Streptomyces sp. NBC_00838]|uniref:serpin family protein n=1 Tax=Streptomyces sp. NBC_00838 TaxID=2903680 RepID=UPI003869E8D7|nr:serpin family protein [Streptomyces sp. NBC_00838]
MGQATGLTTHAGAMQALAERWLRVRGEGEQHGVDGDFVCSPAGLWLALGAVTAGARGETAGELEALLGLGGADVAGAVTDSARALAGTRQLGVATRVWSRTPVYRAYREALPDIGFGHMDPAEIDAWVREATGGLIERLPAEIDKNSLLALVNVLALKARWASPFEGRATSDRPFTDAAGTVSHVPTMHQHLGAGSGWTVDGTQVVELRCEGGESAVRVRFVLGEEGARAAEVLAAGWAPEERRAPIDTEKIALALPRLELRTTTEIKPQLAALGVTHATTDHADFSALSPEPLKIEKVVQEAVVKVAELGVEAAAVTVIVARAAGMYRPPRVVPIAFDRPFGVVVLDGTGEVPLFTAWQATAPRGPVVEE